MRTVDLYVPATSEIVIEGYLQIDPANWDMEGPFAEFTGYVAGDKSPKPTIRVTAITTATTPSCVAPSKVRSRLVLGERHLLVDHACLDCLERARPRRRAGHHRRVVPPVQTGINLLIRMKSSYRNQAKQAANAIWGSSAAHVRYKHITVVDDDIDIHDYAAVDWRSRIASTPARTTSSSCRIRSVLASIPRPASATATRLCSAPASGIGC